MVFAFLAGRREKPSPGIVSQIVWLESLDYEPDLIDFIKRHSQVQAAIDDYRRNKLPVPRVWIFEITGGFCDKEKA